LSSLFSVILVAKISSEQNFAHQHTQKKIRKSIFTGIVFHYFNALG